ncbi:hypothetical protein D8T57_22730 [Vibrio vulnificus]|nr:hypothetical protein D8T57_22730 [Vibrio vulnificus]
MCANKAFKSDSQRLAVSLRSSLAKRCSHLNAALAGKRRTSEPEIDWHSKWHNCIRILVMRWSTFSF